MDRRVAQVAGLVDEILRIVQVGADVVHGVAARPPDLVRGVAREGQPEGLGGVAVIQPQQVGRLARHFLLADQSAQAQARDGHHVVPGEFPGGVFAQVAGHGGHVGFGQRLPQLADVHVVGIGPEEVEGAAVDEALDAGLHAGLEELVGAPGGQFQEVLLPFRVGFRELLRRLARVDDGVHPPDRPPDGVLVEQAALDGALVRQAVPGGVSALGRFDGRLVHEAERVALQGFGDGPAQPARGAGDQDVHGCSFMIQTFSTSYPTGFRPIF